MTQEFDPVTRPKHYNDHSSGIETIRIIEHFSGCMFNCLKYVFRAGKKDGETREKDLRKALWYAKREERNIEYFGAYGYTPIQKYALPLITDLSDTVLKSEPQGTLMYTVMIILRAWNSESDEYCVNRILMAIETELGEK